MKKKYFFITVIATISVNYCVSQNGLWFSGGNDTVKTNRNVVIEKSLTVKGKFTSEFLNVNNYISSDSGHFKTLRLGLNSLVLGSTTYSPFEQIYTDLGPLMIQSNTASSNLNTILNAFPDNTGNVGIGTTTGNTPQFKLDVDNGDININPTPATGINGYRIGGSKVLQYHGAPGSTPSTTNIFVGVGAGASNTFVPAVEGINNTFVGNDAGNSNTIGHSNTSVGSLSLFSNQNG